MQISSNKCRREEVATVIRSCLISRQGDVTIKMLDRDYEEFEGEPIPFKEFNCPSLLVFLNQLHDILWIDKKNGQVIVHPVNSEKSRHVSSLVKGQKSNNSNRKMTRRPYLGFSGGRTPVSIDSLLIMELIKRIKQNPKGLSFDWAIQFVNEFCQPVKISRNELEQQLKQISHEVVIKGNNLYPANQIPILTRHSFKHNIPRVTKSDRLIIENNSQHLNNNSSEILQERRFFYEEMQVNEKKLNTKVEEVNKVCKENKGIKFLPAGFAFSLETKTVERSQISLCSPPNKKETLHNRYKDKQTLKIRREEPTKSQQLVYKEQQNSLNRNNFSKDADLDRKDSLKSKDSYSMEHLSKNQISYKDTETFSRCVQDFSIGNKTHSSKVPYNEIGENYKYKKLVDKRSEEDLSDIIKLSTKIRLTKLIQQYPEGIWISDLPQMYEEEYKIPLIYSELGFSSIADFVSHLPKIFHCVRPINAEDNKLYNAENPLPYLRNEELLTNQTSFYQIHDQQETSPNESKLNNRILLPEGILEIGESVVPINVSELVTSEDYEEVEISEILSPSFFWIQLRRSKGKFKKFMNELNTFYEKNMSKYKIPFALLVNGLNVVCFSNKVWQRGIIRTVFPDERATIHLYDYGREKTFSLGNIYFLHRSFSYLPTQAIPCGLFNVKPYQTLYWHKSVIWKFISKTSIPLIATIGAIDIQENSLLVILTDTRSEDDLHINDWMYDEKLGEQGQIFVKNQNFAFLNYKKSLEQKGYDSSSIHNIRSERLKSNNKKVLGIKTVEIIPTESDSDESRQRSIILKRTQTLLSQYQVNHEAGISENSKSPIKEFSKPSECQTTSKNNFNPEYEDKLLFEKNNGEDEGNGRIAVIKHEDDLKDFKDNIAPLKTDNEIKVKIKEQTEIVNHKQVHQTKLTELPPKIHRLLELLNKVKVLNSE